MKAYVQVSYFWTNVDHRNRYVPIVVKYIFEEDFDFLE